MSELRSKLPMLRMTVRDGPDNESGARPEPHHWSRNGRGNRPLQMFVFVNDWEGFTENQKVAWLRFAQMGEVLESHLFDLGNDECEWVVSKALDGNMRVTSSKRIRIRGLSNVLRIVPKEP